jgi:hypothetical protein
MTMAIKPTNTARVTAPPPPATLQPLLIPTIYDVLLATHTLSHRRFFPDAAAGDAHSGHGATSGQSTTFHDAALLLILLP